MKLTDKINFGKGKIVKDKFIYLDKSICSQEIELTEDMFQVEYEEFILDIGWIPEIDCTGHFRIFLIKKFDWDNPVLTFKPNDFDDLITSVRQCLEYINLEY